jgi:hypothetical protein
LEGFVQPALAFGVLAGRRVRACHPTKCLGAFRVVRRQVDRAPEVLKRFDVRADAQCLLSEFQFLPISNLSHRNEDNPPHRLTTDYTSRERRKGHDHDDERLIQAAGHSDAPLRHAVRGRCYEEGGK